MGVRFPLLVAQNVDDQPDLPRSCADENLVPISGVLRQILVGSDGLAGQGLTYGQRDETDQGELLHSDQVGNAFRRELMPTDPT